MPVKVGTGTFILNELGASVAVVAAPEETSVVLTAAIVPEVGRGIVFPPEIVKLFPLILKLGVDEIV